VPLSRLVRLLGDGTFAWCLDAALHPARGCDAPAHAAALSGYAASRGRDSRAGAEARAALRQRRGASSAAGGAELSQLLPELLDEVAAADVFHPPWSAASDSEADEADATAAAAQRRSDARTAADAADTSAKIQKAVIVGLTPDWLIEACCDIFSLQRPSVARPIVAGLLDPCCNDKRSPNVPAQVLYDKSDDGLALKNSWADTVALLNPPFEASLLWRFTNRAIDEVEWRRSRGVLLVCRNSTDTSYFQRLRPYPRVMLRRDAVRFKDYPSATPIACALLPWHGICHGMMR
jgi:hypothetical protein